MRRVCYVSGSRADFGLMSRSLRLAAQRGTLDVAVCVTGQHLSPFFGSTVDDIARTGLRICGRIPVELDRSTGDAMARAVGKEIVGLTEILLREQPHLVAVLGDRGEMLAGAVAAIHLNIPVVHVHAGERSGTVDEPVRHAISKLAHFHFVTTEGARQRLIRMGEREEHIYVTGAPGLDDLLELPPVSRLELFAAVGFDASRRLALVVFHPVLQEAMQAGEQIEAIMQAVCDSGLQALCLAPNSDAGGLLVREVLASYAERPGIRVETHLDRLQYLGWMAVADIMVGNSSSGIIEAATLNLPVVNVGGRQQGRERSANVIDVPAKRDAIRRAIARAAVDLRGPWRNVYGDGNASMRIVQLLESLPLSAALLYKSNTY